MKLPLPKKENRRFWLIIGLLGILMLFILMVILRGLAYQVIVVPILYLLWLAEFLFDALPQALFWIILLLFLLRPAGRSLLAPKHTLHHSKSSYSAPAVGRVHVWTQRLDQARQGNYSKWGLARKVAELVEYMLASYEQITIHEARARIRNGTLQAPADVLAYLQAGLSSQPPYAQSLMSRWLQKLGLVEAPPESPELDLDITRVAEFLENQLEVLHENH